MTNKGIIIMTLYIIGIAFLLFTCQNNIEQSECERWQSEKQQFQNVGWYPTANQKEQCLKFDIEL